MIKKLLIILFLCLLPISVWATDFTADANCVAAYLMLEGSGTALDNAQGNAGNDGTFVSSGHPAWDTTDVPFAISGSAPNSLDFTPNDYVGCQNDASTSLNRNFSVVFWAKPDVTNAVLAFISHGSNEYCLGMNNATFQFLDSQVAALVQGTVTLSTSAWNHLAFTIDNENPANVNVYLNGNSTPVLTGTTTADVSNGTAALQIGADNSGNGFDGKMTEIAIFSRVLSTAEIAAIYNYGLKPASARRIMFIQ